ncbi:MAG TPA: pyridoxamine 5'-phosphate oxidase family protein [Jatrophihabitans sp.]
MASWQELMRDAPEFAERVQARFDAGTNKTLATLRRDGSPRISATELSFAGGQVSLGMMPRSVKLADVRRDPRVAVHSPTLEPPADVAGWLGDAKLAGVLVEAEPPDQQHPEAAFFRLDITEAVLTYVTNSRPDGPVDQLVVESWHPGTGHRRRSRD